jgi:hypothetical protein
MAADTDAIETRYNRWSKGVGARHAGASNRSQTHEEQKDALVYEDTPE